MTTTISTAQAEYYSRPADERFDTLDAMIAAAQDDKDHSAERTYNLKDLRAVVVDPFTQKEGTTDPSIAQAIGAQLRMQNPTGQLAKLTHYSFGQLARTIGAPASYLRTLPPALVAQNLNHGMHEAVAVGTAANLLVRANGGEPLVRAATSETYGRVWDAHLYGELRRHFGDGISSRGGTWMTPPAWPGSLPSGQYRGDRDSFVIRVEGGSIVSDPSARQGDGQQLYRGILVRNSEVGHCSVTIECVLYQYICGNHMLWGAIMDRKFKRRHVGNKVTRDTISELLSMAQAFNHRSASQDEQIIKALTENEIAHTKEAVIDELKKAGFTKQQAADAYDTAEAKVEASPRSFWGMAQGITRISQTEGYQDERLQLDQMAAALLKRGVAQYATV